MPDFVEVLKGRRTTRQFTGDAVSDDKLDAVLEAVKWAPSWANSQCWEIIVVKDPDQRERIRASIPTWNPGNKAVHQAPMVLVVCAKLERSGYYSGEAKTKFGDWFMFDLGIATQNICLAAHDQGVGSLIVGLFDQDGMKETLGVPEGYELVALVVLGYPEKKLPTPKRREVSEFTHYERF